jgi:predicted nicotinamide N-methyase
MSAAGAALAPEIFVRRNTIVAAVPLVPEIRLHLATELSPLWQASAETLAQGAVPPPFWAFAWPGGQALARHLLDNPALVAGRAVLDFGAGSGLVAIAAAKAGAASALAAEIDPFGAAAIALNAAVNGVAVAVTTADLLAGDDPAPAVVTAGDVCYEQPMAGRVMEWLRAANAQDVRVLIGDPGREQFPRDELIQLAEYEAPATKELEDRDVKRTGVFAFRAEYPGSI